MTLFWLYVLLSGAFFCILVEISYDTNEFDLKGVLFVTFLWPVLTVLALAYAFRYFIKNRPRRKKKDDGSWTTWTR